MAHQKLNAKSEIKTSASKYDPVTGKKIVPHKRKDDGLLMKLVREGYTNDTTNDNNTKGKKPEEKKPAATKGSKKQDKPILEKKVKKGATKNVSKSNKK